jgi:hypothetical protein
MPRSSYYTLVASLPQLPYFESAEWLPISRRQLDLRLTMLMPGDARQLRCAEDLVKWQRQPISRTNEQVARQYRKLIPEVPDPALRQFVEYRMNQRTALVALRRRQLGLGPPAASEVWGVGPWMNLVAASWDRRDLGLGHLLPWIGEAADLLESGQAVELERLLMGAVWRRLGAIADQTPFGFAQVFAFVFRWDILQRWLTYESEKGIIRFKELVAEVTREQRKLFA